MATLGDGFAEFLAAVRDEVVAFRRPVAYVHGDSHAFRIDKAFTGGSAQKAPRGLWRDAREETASIAAAH